TGDLFTTLAEIDGLSDRLELYHAFFSGCGKWEQAPLPVAFGGPYVRVRNLLVY
ncbi:MAG: TldD/PmbA family protein, partial [Clostridia bacterium]|nr:TldD/PmbA family protein [Clostridia bacterium]